MITGIKFWKQPYFLFFVICLIWLPINLYSLNTYFSPFWEDAWESSSAVNWLATGQLENTIFGHIEGIYNNQSLLRLYLISLAMVFKVFGIGLVQGRLFTVLALFVGGWLLFILGRRMYGDVVGLLVGTLYLFSLRTLGPSHSIARPDLWGNAAGIACLLFVWQVTESRKLRQAFWAGVFVAASVDIYLIVAYFSVAASVLMLVEFIRRDRIVLGVFIIGGVVGTLYWLAVRLLPDPYLAISQWQSVYTMFPLRQNLENPHLFSSLIEITYITIAWGIVGHSQLGWLELIYILLGFIALWLRRTPADRFVLISWIIMWIGYYNPYKGLRHLIELVPHFTLAMAMGITFWGNWTAKYLNPRREWANIIIGLSSTLLILGYAVGHLVIGWRGGTLDYYRYATRIESLVPKNSSVLGEMSWWWVLREERTFTADYYLSLIRTARPDLSASNIVEMVMAERLVDVVLLDEYFHVREYDNNPDLQSALVDYTKTYCKLVGLVEDYGYGVETGGVRIKRTEVFVCGSKP